MNIFEMLYPRFYFDKSKPIRLFEAFAGIGCQAMALKRITDNIELVGISEIDVHAIKSYMAIHGQVKNYGDITKMATIPECDIFTWSFPCTDLSKAGKQKGLTDTRSGLVYEVLRLLHNTKIKPKVLIMENVIDLVQVKFVKPFNEIQAELEQLGYTNYNEVLNAKDFEIPQNRERVFMVSILKDELSDHYSYDFPIRKELKLRLKDLLEDEVDEKYYLSKKALKTLTAPNTGKYQRAKAFEFNIKKTIEQGIIGSIPAGDRSGALDPYYAEPQLIQVAQLDGFESSGRIYDENGLAPTINTMGGGQREPKIAIKTWNDETKAYKTKEADMPRDRIYTDESNIGFTITTNSNQQPFIMQKSRGYNKGGKHKDCPPITANSYQENNFVAIPEATEKGYAEAQDGDGVYINRPHQKRGVVQKGMIQTIKTSGDDIGVVVKDKRIAFVMTILNTFGLCGIINIGDDKNYEKSKPLLRILWEEITKEEIWTTFGRFYNIYEKEILQSFMYEKGFFENRIEQKSNICKCTYNSKKYQQPDIEENNLRNVWKQFERRYSSQRWELDEQRFRKLAMFVSKLPQQTAQDKECMQGVWIETQGFRILQQALSSLQEIWRPFISQKQSQIRIRKLSPKECWRLMGISDDDFNKAKAVGMSNSQLYKQAGNGIVVNVFEAILREMIK